MKRYKNVYRIDKEKSMIGYVVVKVKNIKDWEKF